MRMDLFRNAGNAMSRLQIIITAAISAACFVTPFITALVFGMALDNYIVLLASSKYEISANLRILAVVRSLG